VVASHRDMVHKKNFDTQQKIVSISNAQFCTHAIPLLELLILNNNNKKKKKAKHLFDDVRTTKTERINISRVPE
jgi:hypothetical protein